MRAKSACLLIATPIVVVAAIYFVFFAAPHRFVDRSIVAESVEHLRSSARGGPAWLESPADTAFEYLYWWPQIDRPSRAKHDISVSYRSPDEAVVTIIDNDTRDDSVSRTCDRLTLHRDAGLWIPVRHQAAWQGRGRFGWTTQPAL